MKTMHALRQRASRFGLAAAAALTTTAAMAVNDLPGGPKVNQLDLPGGATKMASDIQGLHYLLLVICSV